MAEPLSKPTLPGFRFVGERHAYKRLFDFLWGTLEGTAAAPVLPTSESCNEPPTLASCINATRVDGSAPMRFINLNESPALRVHILGRPHPPTLFVRDEYRQFMMHIFSGLEPSDRRFYLTGQSGIGKSVGTLYILFWLLSFHCPVFFISSTDKNVLYFSKDGVQQGIPDPNDLDFGAAVEDSWVIIDVDIGDSPSATDWYPGLWIRSCAGLVWSSSPLYERRYRFTRRYNARVWYMAPWTLQEIDAMTALEHKDAADVRVRFYRSGPIPRALFFDRDISSRTDVDQVIRHALTKGLLDFATSLDSAAENSSDMLFLIRPREELDPAGLPRVVRNEPSYYFVSEYVVKRTLQLMDQNLLDANTLRGWFSNPLTRPAAGKLVEYILHRALRRAPHGFSPFGIGGRQLTVIGVFGNARDFSIESLPSAPFYVRPQDHNFGAVDSVMVTDAGIWLIRTSSTSWQFSVFETIVAILVQLHKQGVKVDNLRQVYCVVGTDEHRVCRLVRKTIKELAVFNDALRARFRELGQPAGALNRPFRLEVEGYMLSKFGVLTAVSVPLEEDDSEGDSE
ncbi:hypothetical protein DFH06DRAFT_1234220 [Mycena polygramma]|nr:hypothetical protein DFH06DRAFT_1234220 [Mycena polygramma]